MNVEKKIVENMLMPIAQLSTDWYLLIWWAKCYLLTLWGRETHICVNNLSIIGSDNGLLPGRHQAIILTNAGILLIGPLGTNVSGISIEIQTFWFKKMHLKVSSVKWWLFCLDLNVLNALQGTSSHKAEHQWLCIKEVSAVWWLMQLHYVSTDAGLPGNL